MEREFLSYNNNNSVDIANKYPQQWELFKPFADKYQNCCLQMDGIANSDIWENQELKIMTFLKDSYRYDKTDYISCYILDLLNGKHPEDKCPTWRNTLNWINKIRTCLGYEAIQNLSSIAHMNISKTACDANISRYTRKNTLNEAYNMDKKLLFNQYQKINPNIVILGNTQKYFFKMLKENNENYPNIETIFEGQIDGRKPLYIYALDNKTIIFSAYHPSVNATKTSDFSHLIKAHYNKIKSVLSNFKNK